MRVIVVLACWCCISSLGSLAAQTVRLSDTTRAYVAVDAPAVVLKHARLVDGTGSAPKANQTIVVSGGRITYVGDSARATIPANARVLDLAGKTVIPGFVG